MIHSKDHVTNLDPECIQPNAVDLRLDTLERIEFTNSVKLTEDTKQFFPRELIYPSYDADGNLVYHLTAGYYDFTTKHTVTIPEGTAGWLIIRSTLARNGVLLGNGLYDAGYSGIIGGVLHIPHDMTVSKDLRVAQFIMTSADTDKLYDGHYNTTGGFSRPQQ